MPSKAEKRDKSDAPAIPAAQSEQPISEGFAFVATETFSGQGPLPRAEQFAIYVKAQPDAGDRILAMAEEQQRFRHRTDWQIIKTNGRLGYLGLLTNFAMSLSPILASVLLAMNGNNVAAAVVGGSGGVAFACTAIIAAIRAFRQSKD